jgi:N-methylhydantoinase A
MQSAGTTIAADQAADQAVRLLLSGPAGGLAAARSIGDMTGNPRLMSFDMGGTSTDVALLDGGISLTSEGRIGDWPLSIPSVDIHTIGAGGGSIARLDRAGMLLVGPESAGADPGPACYDNGGEQVTVTDANMVLGRIPSRTLLGGYLPLDAAAARDAVARLAADMGCSVLDAARGVVRMANEHMARALRVISVERGHDPVAYMLLSFGGAGGLHACDLAELLGMAQVIIPARSGVLSAVGMLVSEPGRDLSSAVLKPLSDIGDDEIEKSFRALENDAAVQLCAEGVAAGAIRFRRRLELRYQGQSATIAVEYIPGGAHAEAFHEAHQKMSSLRLPHAVELVNLRLGARAPAALPSIDVAFYGKNPNEHGQAYVADLDCEVPLLDREGLSTGEVLHGPLLVTEADATVWVKPEWVVKPDKWGNLFISRSS